MLHVVQALQLHKLNNLEGTCRMEAEPATILPGKHELERSIPIALIRLEEALNLRSSGEELAFE